METGELTLWSSGVWLIPLILLATIVALYFLIRYWRNKSQENLKRFRSELRHFQSNRNQLAMIIGNHSAEDPEPYGSRVAALQEHLVAIDGQIAAMEEQHVSIQQRVRRLAANKWQATVGAPMFWFLLRKEIAQLWKDLAASQASLASAGEFGQAISGLGWEVAQEARQAREIQQQVKRLLDQLQEKKIHGTALETAVRQEQRSREALGQIPRYFLQGEEAVVLDQADKDSIAQAHAILAEHRPLLDQLLAQVQSRERQYAETVNKVTRMRQLLTSVEQSLDTLPAGLDLSPVQARFDQLTVISQNLHATLSRLEVESMPSVAEEAARVHQAAQEMGGQIQQARQQVAALEQVSPQVTQGLKQVAAQITELGNHAMRPVVWDQSSARLSALNRQLTAIGPANKSRTLEQVNQDLNSANQIHEQQKELARHCQQIARQHAEFLGLLSSPELNQGLEWQQEALKLATQVDEYDPENWPQSDRVTALPEELHALSEGLQLLVISSRPKPVSETELPERLDEARQLVQFAGKLRTRVENIQKRLAAIQHAEKTSQEQLEKAFVTLNQVGLLARSNAFLSEVAAQEITRLQNSVRQLGSELEQSQQGPVEKKVKSVNTLVARIEQSGSNWIDQLTKEVQAQRKALSEQLSSLENVAALDEPPVAEARRLVAEGQAFGAGGYGQKSRAGLEEILPELKRRSDYWQNSIAAIRALEDVGKPVFEVYRSVNEYREFVQGQLGDLAAWMRSTRGWPPTSISLAAEQQELSRLEEQWEALRRQPARAISLVAQMGNLSAKYQAAAERARQIAERAAQEQVQVEKLERELDELTQLWQNQWHAYRENPQTTEDIRNLLAEMDGEREALKRQYRQGAKDFSQVLQSLQLLHRKARMAQVYIDENHVIDVNGRVIAYR